MNLLSKECNINGNYLQYDAVDSIASCDFIVRVDNISLLHNVAALRTRPKPECCPLQNPKSKTKNHSTAQHSIALLSKRCIEDSTPIHQQAVLDNNHGRQGSSGVHCGHFSINEYAIPFQRQRIYATVTIQEGGDQCHRRPILAQ